MGLSNEERINFLIDGGTGLIKTLDTTKKYFTDVYGAEKKLIEVQSKIKQFLGELIQFTSNTSSFWLLGPSDLSLSNIQTEYFFSEHPDDTMRAYREEYERLEEDKNLSLGEFANKLGFKYNLLALAYWWDAWAHIDFMVYALNRYDDEFLNKRTREHFNSVIAEMLCLRNLLNNNSHDEQVLLHKYKLYKDEMYSDSFDLTKLLQKLKELTQEELEKIIKKNYKKRIKKASTGAENEEINPVNGKINTENTTDKRISRIRDKVGFYVPRLDILSRLLDYNDNEEKVVEAFKSDKETKTN